MGFPFIYSLNCHEQKTGVCQHETAAFCHFSVAAKSTAQDESELVSSLEMNIFSQGFKPFSLSFHSLHTRPERFRS
jgi:hypothetical protein